MGKVDSESYHALEKLVADTAQTYVFNEQTSIYCMKTIIDVIKDMKLNPMKTEDIRKGINFLFNIEVLNMPPLDDSRFILVPNHVSDLDAIVLGLLHPRIRVVAKQDWTSNERLRQFLDIHYDLYGLDRKSLQSLRMLLKDSIHYFNDSDESKHFLVFSQGTISDFNHNAPERVSSIAQVLSGKTNVPIMPMFVEQVSLAYPTRIVFDEPMQIKTQAEFQEKWLEREIYLQNSLTPPARRPILTKKHSNNNKKGDPFF